MSARISPPLSPSTSDTQSAKEPIQQNFQHRKVFVIRSGTLSLGLLTGGAIAASFLGSQILLITCLATAALLTFAMLLRSRAQRGASEAPGSTPTPVVPPAPAPIVPEAPQEPVAVAAPAIAEEADADPAPVPPAHVLAQTPEEPAPATAVAETSEEAVAAATPLPPEETDTALDEVTPGFAEEKKNRFTALKDFAQAHPNAMKLLGVATGAGIIATGCYLAYGAYAAASTAILPAASTTAVGLASVSSAALPASNAAAIATAGLAYPYFTNAAVEAANASEAISAPPISELLPKLGAQAVYDLGRLGSYVGNSMISTASGMKNSVVSAVSKKASLVLTSINQGMKPASYVPNRHLNRCAFRKC